MKRVVSPLRTPSCTTTTTTTTSNNNNTTTTSQNTTTARWARRRVPSKDHTGMTCVDMEMEPLTQDQDEDTASPPSTTPHRKGPSDKKTLEQKVFHCIDNHEVEELRRLCNDWTVLELRLSSPPAETPLHRVAKKGYVNCLTVLLDTRSEMEDMEIPDSKGQTALLTAVASAQPEVLKKLLVAGANANARDDNRCGALHLLVQELSKDSKNEKQQCRLLEVADELLSSKPDLESHANMDNLTNATPLALAAAKLKQGENKDLLELCKKLIKAGASLSEKIGDTTVKQVFTQLGYLTTELQQQRQSPQRPVAAQVVDLIAMGGSSDEMMKVLQGKPKKVCREAVNSRLGSHSLLFHAVDSGNTSLVKALLEQGAKPWKTEGTLDLPLHHAAEKNDEEIFKLITDWMKGSNDFLYLRKYSASLFKQCVISLRKGQGECFRHLLKECDPTTTAASLNEDAMIETVLPILVFYLKEMSKRDYDTVLDLVLPTTLERAMDSCITLPDKDDMLQLDYRFLLPQRESGHVTELGHVNELELPMKWCHNQQHYQAIKHPLMQTLLSAKRQKVQLINVAYVLCHFFFTTLFTFLCYQRSLFGVGWILVLLMVELFQLYIVRNFRQCFKLLRGAVKVVLIALMLIPIFTRNELVVWSIVFVWYNFVMVLGRFSLLYKYATALHIVTKTFLVLIFVYGGLIAAFACSFVIILAPPGNSNISDFGNVLVNTLVMSLGEFEYSSFSERLNGISAKMLFIGFLFFIVLVVMNVMNSLAVTDIEESVREAEFKKLKAQLETLYTMEHIFMVISRLCSKLNFIRVFKTGNESSLQARICLSDNLQQIQSEADNKTIGTLDDYTIRCLRYYRTQRMQHKQIGTAAKDLVAQHPEVVKTLAAALLSKHKWNNPSAIEDISVMARPGRARLGQTGRGWARLGQIGPLTCGIQPT